MQRGARIQSSHKRQTVAGLRSKRRGAVAGFRIKGTVTSRVCHFHVRIQSESPVRMCTSASADRCSSAPPLGCRSAQGCVFAYLKKGECVASYTICMPQKRKEGFVGSRATPYMIEEERTPRGLSRPPHALQQTLSCFEQQQSFRWPAVCTCHAMGGTGVCANPVCALSSCHS
eukprot:scaffold134816_cov24-Tisochrysis_lutea.AAC.1